ncbi:MAG TPA: hypothetical protein VG675_08395 [Bryobacteraceae bacterium]|nr:hypothetical protein [Bryobacteraceae bacterium]
MPSIKLNDQFGLDADITPGVTSALTQFFNKLPNLSVQDFNLKSVAGSTLEDPKVTSLRGGLHFSEPVDIGADGVQFQVKASGAGELSVFVPPAEGGNLFDPDLYGDNVHVAPHERYISLELSTTAGPEINIPAGKLSFGFDAGTDVKIANYRLFDMRPAAPTVLQALTDTVAGFSIPAGLADLRAIPERGIIALEGRGHVKCSGEADLLAAANPLASVNLPTPLPQLSISAGGSVTVTASCEISMDYQLRVQKIDAKHATIGYYRKRATETEVSVDVHGGISAGTSSTDLFSTLISAISKTAAVDSASLTAAGVPDAQIDAIQSAVKEGAQRKLQLAFLSSLTQLDAQSAAFLYELDLDAVAEDVAAAALRGDLTRFSGSLPAGVHLVRNIFTDLAKTGWTWKLNLLGIYNHVSVRDLTVKGVTLFDPTTGDVTITDTITAQSVRADTVNFGADSEKLRNVLAGSFLITAAYRAGPAQNCAPELKSTHSYFVTHADTSRQDLDQEINAVQALGFAVPGVSPEAGDLGRTTIYAETAYDDRLTTALFLDAGNARAVSEYDRAGRQALRLLVHAGDADEYRLRPAVDDALWNKMRDAGPFNFAPLFPDLPKLAVEVIASDYVTVVWWAEAMHSAAELLADMRGLEAAGGGRFDDPRFIALRRSLDRHLATVTKDAKNQFGLPWGLVAMDLVSGGSATARAQITGKRLALHFERSRAAAAT